MFRDAGLMTGDWAYYIVLLCPGGSEVTKATLDSAWEAMCARN